MSERNIFYYIHWPYGCCIDRIAILYRYMVLIILKVELLWIVFFLIHAIVYDKIRTPIKLQPEEKRLRV